MLLDDCCTTVELHQEVESLDKKSRLLLVVLVNRLPFIRRACRSFHRVFTDSLLYSWEGVGEEIK